MKCTMCGGPFHEATGHWVSDKRHWCGPCTRSMIDLLKSMLPRRWGGLRFYDYAIAPTGDTTGSAIEDPGTSKDNDNDRD